MNQGSKEGTHSHGVISTQPFLVQVNEMSQGNGRVRSWGVDLAGRQFIPSRTTAVDTAINRNKLTVPSV